MKYFLCVLAGILMTACASRPVADSSDKPGYKADESSRLHATSPLTRAPVTDKYSSQLQQMIVDGSYVQSVAHANLPPLKIVTTDLSGEQRSFIEAHGIQVRAFSVDYQQIIVTAPAIKKLEWLHQQAYVVRIELSAQRLSR